MSKLVTFLEQLDDHELACFYKYRFEQFITGSKEKIMTEMQKREMNTTNYERFIQPESLRLAHSKHCCPQCMSEKFYNSTELETITYSYVTESIEVEYRTCLVCLFSGKGEDYERHRSVSAFEFIRTLITRRR